MSSSARSRRMARNHKRMARPAKLNLVALMDIFTILVLFLIVNNGDVEILQSDKNLALPESVSEQRPEAALVLKITPQDILLAGEPVGSVENALSSEADSIPSLADALAAAAEADPARIEEDHSRGRPITIMGDRTTHYALLKKVMTTCAASDYRDVSLAVNSVPLETTGVAESALALSASSGQSGGAL